MTTLDGINPSAELRRLRTNSSDFTLGIARLAGALKLTFAEISEVKRASDQPIADAGPEPDLLGELRGVEIPGLGDEDKQRLVGFLARLSRDVQVNGMTPAELIQATAPNLEESSTRSE
jgi:hypothetical protein